MKEGNLRGEEEEDGKGKMREEERERRKRGGKRKGVRMKEF